MQKCQAGGLKIHASICPESKSGKEAPAFIRKKKQIRFLRGDSKNASRKLSLSDRLLRNTAIACAMLLGVLAIRNVDQPWSHLALDGIESALTMKIDLDESLGKLSFVRDLVPESALVFLDISAQSAFAPVNGTITHAYSESQPWTVYQCEPLSAVQACEPATVAAVTQLDCGDWGVILDHGNGLESIYAYLGEVSVKSCDTVSAGTILGKAPAEESTGIYFELRENGVPIDPDERLSL